MKIEPHADTRRVATDCMQIYTAFMDVGFTEEQAMGIIEKIITTGMNNSKDEK